MLNDDTRGATMEAVVSRMKTVESALTRSSRGNETEYAGIRFMAISATVPNVQDVSVSTHSLQFIETPVSEGNSFVLVFCHEKTCFRWLLGWMGSRKVPFATGEGKQHR